MRRNGTIATWSACGLILAALVIFVAGAVLSGNHVVHPIDVGAALGPWICMSLSIVGLALAIGRLLERATSTLEEVALGLAIPIVICEIPLFLLATVALALGIPFGS